MEYKQYFVAFIDILGFKNMLKDYSCDDVYQIFTIFKKPLVTVFRNGERIVNPSDFGFKVMSDSIVIFIDKEEKEALFQILATCMHFQATLANQNKPILLRGGIVLGNFYFDGDIMYGKALSDAYLLEDKNAKYPRIITTKSLLLEYGNDDCEEITYEDDDSFITIDYINHLFSFYKQGAQPFLSFEEHVLSTLNQETDNSIRDKYLYLKNRINEIKKYRKMGEDNA